MTPEPTAPSEPVFFTIGIKHAEKIIEIVSVGGSISDCARSVKKLQRSGESWDRWRTFMFSNKTGQEIKTWLTIGGFTNATADEAVRKIGRAWQGILDDINPETLPDAK